MCRRHRHTACVGRAPHSLSGRSRTLGSVPQHLVHKAPWDSEGRRRSADRHVIPSSTTCMALSGRMTGTANRASPVVALRCAISACSATASTAPLRLLPPASRLPVPDHFPELEQRKPRWRSRDPGWMPNRNAARTNSAGASQPPPRMTRNADESPTLCTGSVTWSGSYFRYALSRHHSHTLPSMSNSPKSFGCSSPTG